MRNIKMVALLVSTLTVACGGSGDDKPCEEGYVEAPDGYCVEGSVELKLHDNYDPVAPPSGILPAAPCRTNGSPCGGDK